MGNIQISLAAARVNAKMTQEEAARALGVSKQTICSWEKEKTIPNAVKLREISRVYGIDGDNIFLAKKSK